MITLDELAELARLAQQGKDNDEIAQKTGYTTAKVRYWKKRLREDGIDIPIRKGPKPLDINKLK